MPEAARKINRDPETVRRWIRAGRLRSQKVGTQHLIDEADLLIAAGGAAGDVPAGWDDTVTGEPMPDWTALVRELRDSR